jgi:DhnA family fructose-bisphosphate aldolase class Ia
MPFGKTLRLRRIFANGRALIAPLEPNAENPVAMVHTLARGGADGVAVSPGILERVVEEVAALAIILRLNSASSRLHQLVSVQGALEMGAEAVVIRVDAHDGRDLERLGRVTDEARRLGMPVIADIAAEDPLSAVSIAADYGVDVMLTQAIGDSSDLRHLVRIAGRPILVAPGHRAHTADLLQFVARSLDAGVQGIMIEPCPEPLLAGMHALVHQGASVEEALALAHPQIS